MSKVLLDTNILVYSIDEESRFFQRAQRIISNTNYDLFTTSKNLSEFLAVVTRFPKNALTIDEALQSIDDFQTFTTILFPTDRTTHVFRELLLKYKPTGLKIHDFEIVSIGLANQIKKIATLNVKDVQEIEEIDILRV